ncbi:hypothetical protein GUITHDRAFT_162521 [Guillardia theta CCMP2712]|uniref:Uncharacterized protein n=1 Tax=Guillardia theta (strain CCMP2712) TaxID=905079 RepID=L1JHS1_GUITC|nr:hypothetical protein GUITHDRAFT_162521 [Guillardia theta CCMP2712]EKX48073.1 hypothetical protein GUITHDRAFT_162521 [Guillardia theta CCMP2712]|eukprot:XP_005835053.1 hypothetical protein GUITHDRAFT_162521 [Guillardia theta CCMP2712]
MERGKIEEMERLVAKIFDKKIKPHQKKKETQGKYSLRQMLKEERAAQSVIKKSGLGKFDDSKQSGGDSVADDGLEGNRGKKLKSLENENKLLREQLKMMTKALQSGGMKVAEDAEVEDRDGVESEDREESLDSLKEEDLFATHSMKRRRPSCHTEQDENRLQQRKLFVLPGISEMWTAKLASKLKIPAIVFSESSACLRFGLPHASLVSWSDYKTALSEISPAFPLKQIFADHPHCFETRREAIYYMQLLESMGVGAVVLGDRSKSMTNDDVVDADEFFSCLKSAVNARTNDEVLIFARTSMSCRGMKPSELLDTERDIARRLLGAMACGIDGVILDCWSILPEGIETLKRVKERLGSSACGVLYLHPQQEDDWNKFGGKLKNALQDLGFKVILRPDDLHLAVASTILNKLKAMTTDLSAFHGGTKESGFNVASSLTSSQDINDLIQTQHLSQLELEIM